MGLELTHAIAINLEMFMHDSIGEIGYSLCDYVCSVYALYTWELEKEKMFLNKSIVKLINSIVLTEAS